MNPPSALHGAMSRDRKPFTYTPGGLDLSEIKSERMAKRLMRNAMNQGVPEVPSQPIQSPPMPSTPIALPNYNCLPVQVFPAFNLPANPKALLRTRSHPEPREPPVQRVIPPTFANNSSSENNYIPNKNTIAYPQVNNNKPVLDYKYAPGNIFSLPRTNYGSDGYTPSMLPEISYEAEYLRALPRITSDAKPIYEEEETYLKDNVQTNDIIKIPKDTTTVEIPDVPLISITPLPIVPLKVEDEIGTTEDEKKEVKVVKKISTKQNNVEQQNGDKNGDDVEAEMTVQLPEKKSAAKTETKVEVAKKVLPDGSTEEVKTTTTTTTIDGRTEIRTKTETKITPKELEVSEEEVEEEEEEEEEVTGVTEVNKKEQKEEAVATKTVSTSETKAEPKENGHSEIIKTEEKSEVVATKKVVVVQETPTQDETEEVEEEITEQEEFEEAEPVTIVLKKQPTPEPAKPKEESIEDVKEGEAEEEIESETEVEPESEKSESKQEVTEEKVTKEVEKEIVDEEVVEEEEEEEEEITKETKTSDSKKNEDDEVEEEEYEETEDKKVTKDEKEPEEQNKNSVDEVEEQKVEESENTETVVTKTETIEIEQKESVEVKIDQKEPEPEPEVIKLEPEPQKEYNIPIREPSVPMEKVEDVEIKPIGSSPIITKSHTENTEIITSKIDPSGGISTQTEYNKVENIVTVNRTTKILDHNYENLTQQGIPTVKTYFVPPSRDRISTSPLPSKPYQTQYSEPTTERRHSLLLERLSMERQMPSEIYSQYSTQIQEQSQMDEPRVEVLTVSNVKPSTITNQQWYQQSKQQNTIYNNVTSTPTPSSQPWVQPKAQPQQQYQPQPQYQAQPSQTYQPPPQQQYQPSTPTQYQPTTPTQYQPPTPTQYQPPTQPQYQPPTQTQYQPSQQPYEIYTDHSLDRSQTNYSSYTPAPSWPTNTVDKPPAPATQYSYYNKDSTDSYQNTTQNYSSSYVPPPWEQDASYVTPTNTHTIYQVPAQSTPTSSLPSQSWAPAPPSAKYTKTPPIAFIPPAPNQSFVKPVSTVDPPRVAGRKTYYSEYERRYITVPESTYIPTETRYQPQPDPSPQYYYDNNEQPESVEPQWRRELREFTEKTSQTQQTETTSVQPPWNVDSKYVKPQQSSSTYSSTQTWSQTVRPRSWRERSFESEYVGSQEWPKTNTLGRGRPLSTLGKSTDSAIPERVRGVSVDRYNPNNYQSPAEHPPVQAHTLTTPIAHQHPNVPGYHARASAEPRAQPYQTRVYREARESPIQSRSFKYLQWITGTEN